jgi:hypothetical protein
MTVTDQSSFNISAYFTAQVCLWLEQRQIPLKVTDIMTKYKHKTEHSVFPVGLKGSPEDDFRKNISMLLESSYIKRL